MKFFSWLFRTEKRRLQAEQLKLEKAELELTNRLDTLRLHKKLLSFQNENALHDKQNSHPLICARVKLSATLQSFKAKRNKLQTDWDAAYEKFSWWNQMKYSSGIDLSDLDKQIAELEVAVKRFDNKYQDDITKLKLHFQKLKIASENRIENAYKEAKALIENEKLNKISSSTLAATWLAGLSIPVSIAGDLYASNPVFDALRSVNSNFENLSNTEIWWETLWMSPESLTGLASLTKGAYFEQLVANDTGGELFEHFNHAQTDITIDGIEYQIKATDSVAYINTVDDDIPVIATSEVASVTDSIDGGYTDQELSSAVDLALGGAGFDAHDTAIDAILTGVGSLGIFATVRGINHAQAQYDKGVKSEEAIFEGLAVAIEGTAKGVVDTAEMAYKAATSKPMRFVGRNLYKGLEKLDKKLFGEVGGTKDRNEYK